MNNTGTSRAGSEPAVHSSRRRVERPPPRSSSAAAAQTGYTGMGGVRQPPTLVEFSQEEGNAGILVTNELEKAQEKVRQEVRDIVRECKTRNMRFRDIEFDLEEDREKCLHSLGVNPHDRLEPADVQRVTQIFKNPQFFKDGANDSDVVQGQLADCWLLSGVANVASMPRLMNEICVARDERIGVYGFVIQRDGIWRGVIVDDLLFTCIPKYEELTLKEQRLYHSDKATYNQSARHGTKGLFFAHSASEDESWVPLLEKAYAKLHGDYSSLQGGMAGDAVEDLTGGVSTVIHVKFIVNIKDILDTDQFWRDELQQANEDRLFACSLYRLHPSQDREQHDDIVNGLQPAHAYSILKATEVRGKKFLRIRNPWGNTEWTGPWSDGSKEWTKEWRDALEELEHEFGDDGTFLMEYTDFLQTWTLIHRTKIFDRSWIVSSLWINTLLRRNSIWDFGDVSFSFHMDKSSPVIIQLSQMDPRYLKAFANGMIFTLDFRIYAKGKKQVIATASHATFTRRSVNAEIHDLPPGDYIVHVRVDRMPTNDQPHIPLMDRTKRRKIYSALALNAVGRTHIKNFDADQWDQLLPRPIELFAGRDLNDVEIMSHHLLVQKLHPPRREERPPTPPPTQAPHLGRRMSRPMSSAHNSRAPSPTPSSAPLRPQPPPPPPPQSMFVPNSASEAYLASLSGMHLPSDDGSALLSDSGESVSYGESSEDEYNIPPAPPAVRPPATRHARSASTPIITVTPHAEPFNSHRNDSLSPGRTAVDLPQRHESTRYSSVSEDIHRLADLGADLLQGGTQGYCYSCGAYISPHGGHDCGGQSPAMEGGLGLFQQPIPQMHVPGSACRDCQKAPMNPHNEPVYVCLDVTHKDWAICAECYSKGSHDPTHAMLKRVSSETAHHLRTENAYQENLMDLMNAENELALGLRVFSKKDCHVEIKGQLRHGRLIKYSHVSDVDLDKYWDTLHESEI